MDDQASRSKAPTLVVDVGDSKVSNKPEDVIVTYALGSCVGVTAYDTLHQVGGVLHFMLPDSKINGNAAYTEPDKYLDTAIPNFLKKLVAAGAERRFLEFKAFGGANGSNPNTTFNVAERNIDALRALAKELRLWISVWEVGGQDYRTIKLFIDSGGVWVKTPTRELWR